MNGRPVINGTHSEPRYTVQLAMYVYLRSLISTENDWNSWMNRTVNKKKKRISFSFIYFLYQSADRPESHPTWGPAEPKIISSHSLLVACIFSIFSFFWILLSGVHRRQRLFLALFFFWKRRKFYCERIFVKKDFPVLLFFFRWPQDQSQ